MEEHKKLIIVPWDFSHVAGHALAHAVKIGRMVGSDICLLHIVETGISAKAYAEKTKHLKLLVEENGIKYNIPIIYHISKGLSLIHISEPTRLLSISYAVFCL